MPEEVLLTKEGFEKIKAEYEELVSVTRREVAERIKEAREFGDISENAEYDAAKNEQAELEERINKLEDMMRKAKIIEEGKSARGKVNIGSKVKIKELSTKKEGEYIIVGSTEADPFANKISNESAVGKAIIGHKAGDVVEVEVKGRETKLNYEIISINKK
ncbi:MAG: transcription elongation factor GreA [Eubacteriaceae bacterium]|nr:transcription elongation factor GreA [Eubacteriaceae bacterium]